MAGIVADLMGDEHLQDEPKLRLDYTSKSKEELERFNREILNLFGISGKIRKCSTNKYGTMNLGVNNKPLGRVLRLIGVPTGCKVLKKFQIPQWIFDDKKNFSRFVNRIFSCEACVDVPYKAIDFSMWKSVELIEEGTEFFRQIKYHLSKHFDIETTNPFLNNNLNTRKDGIKTQCIRIKIKKLPEVLRQLLLQEISFTSLK